MMIKVILFNHRENIHVTPCSASYVMQTNQVVCIYITCMLYAIINNRFVSVVTQANAIKLTMVYTVPISSSLVI